MRQLPKIKKAAAAVLASVCLIFAVAVPAYATGVWCNGYSLPSSTKLGSTATIGGNMGYDSTVVVPVPSLCYIQVECPATLFSQPSYTSGSFSSMTFKKTSGMAGSTQYVGVGSNWITGTGTLLAYANTRATARGTGKGYVGTGPVEFQRDVFGTMKVV